MDPERARWEARHRDAPTAPAPPSPFVVAALDAVAASDGVAPGARALDVACGRGRHARLLAARGYRVEAVDHALAALRALRADTLGCSVACIAADVRTLPLPEARYAIVVVIDFLERALFAALAASVRPGGVLVMETFLVGQERLGHPRNPGYLLRPGELRAVCTGWTVLTSHEGETMYGGVPALRAGIAARKPLDVDIAAGLRSTPAP